MKSQAVFVDGAGIPGVSGDVNVYRPAAPGAIRAGAAKLAGVVPLRSVEGFPPTGGSGKETDPSARPAVSAGPEVGIRKILFDSDQQKSSGAIGLIVS
jgi:hypothetical protein